MTFILVQNQGNTPSDIVAENAKLKQELKKTKDELISRDETIRKAKDELISRDETIRKLQQQIEEMEIQNRAVKQDEQQVL